MAKAKNQHQQFAYEAIPLVFHNENLAFLELLKRDGIKFLRFWWDRVGINLAETERISADGLSFEVHPYQDGRTIVLIKMPIPHKEREAYFLGMVSKPPKRSFLPWFNFAYVYVLTYAVDENGSPSPELGEVTRTARYVPIGEGSKPTLEAFYKRILDILDKKKRK